MKKLVLCMLALFALYCLAGRALAQAPPPAPSNVTPGPSTVEPRPAPALPAPKVRLEPAKVIGDELAARELKDVGGRPFRLADYRGRVFVINVWATWCVPCRLEVPGLNAAYGDFVGRGVEFVGLTTEDPERDAAKVRAFAREFDVKYRLGWLDLETGLALLGDRHVLPQTFVVGADGRVVLHIRGYNQRVPEMVRAGVERALAAAQPPAASTPTPDAPAHPAATPAPRPSRP